jgi:hypothetical protein
MGGLSATKNARQYLKFVFSFDDRKALLRESQQIALQK